MKARDENDGADWLERMSASEWIHAAIGELSRAEDGFRQRNGRGGVTACKRAAGMALNGALRVAPNPAWGRTYLDHLEAVARDPAIPVAVREASAFLYRLDGGATGLVALWTPAQVERVLDACRTVMAEAYAVVHGSVGRRGGPDEPGEAS